MKKNSLKVKVWLYLSVFTIVILGGLWLFQIIFLDTYYEFSKNYEIKSIASKVLKAYKQGSYHNILDTLSFKEDVCIQITNGTSNLYTTDNIGRGCLINSNSEIKNYKLNFILSNGKSVTYKVMDPKFENKTLIYGLKIDSNIYAFISTSLEPIGSTVSVLKNQLIYVTIIVLIIAFLIAYTISKKISKPIEEITETSKKMAEGNYNIEFKTNSDIKEITELEATLNSTALELSKTESLRRELLANVSHDLKTPLTLIKANAEMVKDLTYNNKEKRNKNLNTITDEVDRLNLLVEDILDLSKMQTTSFKLNIEEFNINEMIKSIIERFDILCDTEKYIINYEGFDCYIKADKKKLEQAIYNLINNAINYTGEDKCVFIKLTELDNAIKVEIRDTGKGIEKQDINYIWDKYYKVDKKYKRVSYGTGLGLSIVKNVFKLHNFKYGVSSKKNIGTTFYFEINKM